MLIRFNQRIPVRVHPPIASEGLTPISPAGQAGRSGSAGPNGPAWCKPTGFTPTIRTPRDAPGRPKDAADWGRCSWPSISAGRVSLNSRRAKALKIHIFALTSMTLTCPWPTPWARCASTISCFRRTRSFGRPYAPIEGELAKQIEAKAYVLKGQDFSGDIQAQWRYAGSGG